jgi:biopolymer transport protein ExbB
MHIVFTIFLLLTTAVFSQIDLVKQQAEINSAKADLEGARQVRDMAVAKRWQEKAKQNEERERIDQAIEKRKEKTEAILSERSRLFEELRISREALDFANEDAEKARSAFASVFPGQGRVQELESVNKGTIPFAIPEISEANFKDSPLQAAEILFSIAKKNTDYVTEIEILDSLARLGGVGVFPLIETDSSNFLLVSINPMLNAGPGAVAIGEQKKTLKENFEQLMHDGGILMYPIAAMFIFALLLIAERFFALFKNRKIYEKITKTVSSTNLKTREDAEKALEALFAEAVPHLESRLSAISVLGTTAPLLGLLGTVMGMIELFNVITMHGTADPKLLAGGISIALITTEAGLSVAIPVHLLHTWIVGRVEKTIAKMDLFAMELVNSKFKN